MNWELLGLITVVGIFLLPTILDAVLEILIRCVDFMDANHWFGLQVIVTPIALSIEILILIALLAYTFQNGG